MQNPEGASETHSFVDHPHRTLLHLSIPVLISLVAEPLTGLVDTAFIASLGAVPLAALGIGTTALSSVFWIFNFLGVGSQTEIARASGGGDQTLSRRITGVALLIGIGFGFLLVLVGYPLAPDMARLLGGEGAVQEDAVSYIRIRLFAAPAVLITLIAFGALRGKQDMRTPMWIALTINACNVVLDFVLIFGYGPIPAMGIEGAALASAISYWGGAIMALRLVWKRIGFPQKLEPALASRLFVIGGDLFIRTGMLTLFLLLTTRVANQIGADGGAAHQAIRQFWMFAALLLDAFALAGQSLVGYFHGAANQDRMKQVARVVCLWSLWTGVGLTLLMLAGQQVMIRLFVPETAIPLFASAWLVAALFQPLNALSFGTDGLHWGTGDFRFLRNAIITATLAGACMLYFVDPTHPNALFLIWLITGSWITIRAIFGIARIWPGIGQSPFK